MLTEMPVAALSLNELSRRVGLAKSNVMRYFESREAILLEMLNTELQAWAEQLTLPATGGTESPEQLRAVANAFAASMDERHTMCDLISAQASVLERNVSAEVALRHKIGVGTSVTDRREASGGAARAHDRGDLRDRGRRADSCERRLAAESPLRGHPRGLPRPPRPRRSAVELHRDYRSLHRNHRAGRARPASLICTATNAAVAAEAIRP